MKTLLILLSTCTCSFAAQHPNILLIMADDQGWGDTGYNGHPFVQTPNLDAMVANGAVFNRFYAAAPVCSPTRGSVLTGRNPNRINILDHGHYMRPQEETIAEALKRAGYVTGHFGKWHVGSVQKESPVCPGNSGFDRWVSGPNFFDLDPYLSDNGTARQYQGESSAIIIDQAIEFLDKHLTGSQPVFSIVWFSSPHGPFQSFDKNSQEYAGKNRAGYYEEITVMDRQIGRLRDYLREKNVHDNTLIWYCSDNGGLVPRHTGGRGSKGVLYEGGLRVPGIIEWPARLKPAKNDFVSSTSDIYPTLLEVAGLKPAHDHPLDGESLLPALEGKTTQRQTGIGFWRMGVPGQATWSDRIVKAIMEAQKEGRTPAIPERLKKQIDEFPQYAQNHAAGHSVWLQWPWKLHAITKGGSIQYALYNLETNPMEADPSVTDRPEVMERMKTSLSAWRTSVIHSLNGKDY